MPFTEFKSLRHVGETYGIEGRLDNLFLHVAPREPEPSLTKTLDFALRNMKVERSEMYLREFLIAPLIMHALYDFPNLTVWSDGFHIQIDERLSGVPDYVVSAVKAQGQLFGSLKRPLLAIAEAKREDYIGGWGQCLAEMVACQRLNGDPETPVWGIVTTGIGWEFARLVQDEFTQHNQPVDLRPVSDLLGVLYYVFAECQAIAEKWAAEAKESHDSSSETN